MKLSITFLFVLFQLEPSIVHGICYTDNDCPQFATCLNGACHCNSTLQINHEKFKCQPIESVDIRFYIFLIGCFLLFLFFIIISLRYLEQKKQQAASNSRRRARRWTNLSALRPSNLRTAANTYNVTRSNWNDSRTILPDTDGRYEEFPNFSNVDADCPPTYDEAVFDSAFVEINK